MIEKFSCVGMELPKWIPEVEECVWCHHHTQQPVEIEITEEDFRVYYECSNEKCEHKNRHSKPAPFGLIFDGPKFAEQYISFVKEEQKKPEGVKVDEK